jgi:hypothetical protein
MRKTLLIFFLTQAIVISVVAKKIDGLIIYPNDTIRVTFNIPTNIYGTVPYFFELQKSIIYFDSDGEKKKIKPKDALEIQFALDNVTYRMLSRKMNFYTQNSANSDLLDSVMFLNLEVDGYLRLFSFNNPDMGAQNRKVNYLFQKNDGELKWLSWYRPKKDLLEYMKDCDSAIEMINQSNAFLGVNVISLVQKYNSECAKE